MTWQQWAVSIILTVNTIGQFFLLYREPNGKEAFSRVIAAIISPGALIYALYSADFWH